MYHQHKCGNPDHDCGSYYQVEWVYMVNKISPSTDPCGTPYFSVTGSDVLDPIWTICILSRRYDLNHLKVSPLIPNEWFNRSKSFWWSMVSKAALRSKSVNMAPTSESTAWMISFCTRRRAVSVLWSCTTVCRLKNLIEVIFLKVIN